jgi:hypothetical protein
MHLPETLVTYATGRWGHVGQRWLERLPATVAALASRWELADVTVSPASNRSLVCSASAGRDTVWLKVECDPRWRAAADTLSVWAKVGAAPDLLRVNDTRRATLLAHAGEPLHGDVITHTEPVGELVARAHGAPVPVSVKPVGDLGVAVARRRLELLDDCPFDPGLLAPLALPAGRDGLLHGDLTGRNVLHSQRGLQLIDPEPATGPIEVDLARWCVRAETGHRWAQHAAALEDAVVDHALFQRLLELSARTYVAYALTCERDVSDEMLELARGRLAC